MTDIRMIEKKGSHRLEDLAVLDADGELFVADFYLRGSEDWDAEPWGLEALGHSVINVDHHAPLPQMRRYVSSANLALELLKSRGRPDPGRDLVVVNHLDCDSVLTAGLLSGRLTPEPRYGDAAIAADHTGQENEIADLLQGMDGHWSRTKQPVTQDSIEDFFDALQRLERGQEPTGFAAEALDHRRQGRDEARRLVAEEKAFIERDGIYFARLEEPIEGELFLPLLPHARLILTINALNQDGQAPWQTKMRLRESAGFSLHDLGIPEHLDDGFGGRWNAGSNKRDGGTDVPPEEYFEGLVELVRVADGR